MPDGMGFFSATRASNRFDVGEWNICKQLTSRRHRGLPQSTRRLYQSRSPAPWAPSGSLLILPSYYQNLDFCDCRHSAADRASLFSAIMTPRKKTLEELKREAIAELERRGYDVRGRTPGQIRQILRRRPTKPKSQATATSKLDR
jgi:hypothetical protein